MNEFNDNSHQGPNGPDDLNRYKSSVAKRNMSTAALICSIIAVLTFQLFFISLPLAGASVILALLSRTGRHVGGRARIALIGGIAAMIMSCLFTWYAIRTVYRDPALRAQVEQLYNYYTGQLSGTGESEEQPPSENPQELLHDILSGNYRERQDSQVISDDVISQNGGALI